MSIFSCNGTCLRSCSFLLAFVVVSVFVVAAVAVAVAVVVAVVVFAFTATADADDDAAAGDDADDAAADDDASEANDDGDGIGEDSVSFAPIKCRAAAKHSKAPRIFPRAAWSSPSVRQCVCLKKRYFKGNHLVT